MLTLDRKLPIGSNFHRPNIIVSTAIKRIRDIKIGLLLSPPAHAS